MRAVHIDVSDLDPPEPMERTLAALRALGPNEYLVVHHRREPFPLYDLLGRMGFAHEAQPGQRTAVEVRIWRRNGETPADS